jgi:signal transduction histidine kinase
VILLVEDDAATRQMFEQVITAAGYGCAACASGEAAVELVAGSTFQAAVVDLELPGIDGVELARRLKAAHEGDPLFPVILVSGTTDPGARVRALTAGCDDFLAKPVDLQELIVRLRGQLARRAEVDALAQANRQLRDLERRKRDLTALVVHDLRSPLAGVIGAAELLKDALAADPPDLESARQLTEQVELLATKTLSLVASMLDVEELEQGMLVARVEEVWLTEFLGQIMRPYLVHAGARQLAMSVEAPAGMRARFDPGLVSRVIENLLDNGVRYAARRGRVVLRARPQDGALCIEVGNDGPAVPVAAREHIFDRYFQIEARRVSARENRGLGLYFCRLAAEAHGGTIAVTSEASLTCLFQLRLPQPAP